METWGLDLADLWASVIQKKQLENELDAYRNTGQSKAQEEENRDEISQRIAKREKRLADLLRKMHFFPEHHRSRHGALLDEFWKRGSFEQSVFVMTKYPDGASPLDQKLLAVIEAVKSAIVAAGFTPRLALDHTFHPQMWDNIELYLIGCQRGIAIVENKHTAETNPNVSMEWGWMRGMGRNVLYLIEKDFKHPRADFAGFISHEFDFDDPATVSDSVKKWL